MTRKNPRPELHAESARKHAMKRAWQRYGIAVALPELVEAEKRIWAGKATWIADQVQMRSVYRTKVKGRDLVVVFDVRLDAIVTVLPQHWAERSARNISTRKKAA